MYNNFGLKFYDIVNLFSGEESDFATPGKNNGKDNIEDEMDIQIGKIISKMPANVLRLFEFVEYAKMDQEVSYISGVGTRFKFPDTVPPLVTGAFSAYYTDQRDTCSSSSNLTLGNNNGYDCSNHPICSQGSEVTVGTVSGSDGEFYGITVEDVDLTDKDLYVSYEVDSDSEYFEIKELKGCLRDMVACILGGKLLLEGENEWRLLDTVCATTFAPAANWVPSEFRKLKWWRKPWNSGGMAIGTMWRG